MNPLRLIILFLLFYILYRLLFKEKRGRDSLAGGPVQDVLVEDPVCHTYIPKGQAIPVVHNKTTYHFCSKKCRETFLTRKGDNQ